MIIVSLLLSTLSSVADDPPRPDPDKPVDYLEWLNATYGRDGEDNAADQYDAAAKAYVDDEEARKIISAPKGAVWTTHDRDAIRTWVASNEECLSIFAAATKIRHCYFELDLHGRPLKELYSRKPHPARYVARLLTARAKLRLNGGDWRGAVDDCAALRRFAHHLMGQPVLIDYLVGVGAAGWCYDVLLDVPRRAAEDADYPALVREVRKFDRPISIRPGRQLETEKLILWDMIQRELRDTDGDGEFDHLEETAIEPATMENVLAETEEAFDRLRKAFTADYETANRQSAQFKRWLSARKSSLAGMSLTGLSSVARHQRQLKAERNAVRIVLRLHAYHAEHGNWPKTLADATKGAPSPIRRDPFSGKDMVYRVVDGRPLLYSVGRDGDDDGGKPAADGKRWSAEGDALFWP